MHERDQWKGCRNTKLKTSFSIILLIIIISGIAYHLATNRDLLDALWRISAIQVVLLIILRTVLIGSNGLYLKIFAAKFDVNLKAEEWIGLSFITTMGNQIMPLSGGTIARAVYLKQRYALPYTRFVTMLAANYLVTFWIVGIAGLFACLATNDLNHARLILSAFFLAVIVFITLVLIMPYTSLPDRNRITRAFNIALEGWFLIKADRRLLVLVASVALLSILLNGVSFWIAYQSIHMRISVQAAMLVSLLPFFLSLVNVTPGNLGVQEAMIGLLSGFIGRGLGEGLLVALLIRAATLIPAFIAGPICSYALSRNHIHQ